MIDKVTLRELRLMRERTQQEIADFLGVDRSTYASWEKTNTFDFSIVVRLCEYYKVDIQLIKE
ncbi:helix-turn-helix transcriptional regulator [Coprobacillus cateniformis]|uniref:helix-turn-helix transcriptional regulator n=1 Tax=Coprobacillus cateniformis TaxID=100884 RepID=UPI00266DC146|nr:helix-turn-helix transcriptional regulator [Coprobacillus cateniformis]